ncbi:MAG: uracil phosphoribosyltransferase [Flavobacteriales bacterium]|jgi:uracil phosphoribosyltransferase
MIHDLSRRPGMLGVYITELRDRTIQGDRLRFRHNLERVGECMALEMAREWSFAEREITTPLGETTGVELADQPVLATILRAGLPMHAGMLRMFDRADNAFISAYRRYDEGGQFEIAIDAMSAPTLEGRRVILIDPMLATGASVVQVVRELHRFGTPSQLVVACAIASREGVAAVKERLGAGAEIWAAAIDDETTAKGYIVPGLGDAGDLAFGVKR